ncbi:MFS transporter [Legionella sp. km772]|uniref:MFS transporter n=1 Tax=Legionella sp. km772 TaxID=2498111 RepID=UPI000F8DCC06|nr:MFS transporter [Legionella sp. km772]RUR08874.1 MFS transporter [Legionella sp. km772]
MGLASLDLLKERRFLPLFITQFFGAFNDNAFKLAMLTLISYRLSGNQAQSEFYQALASGLFIVPFFIFSSISGQIADKYDKALLTRLIKIFEVILIIIGALGLYISSIFLMMITLTGMGVHSAFFGPIKYAILPDHLLQNELLVATGWIEGSTFLAILLGTTLGTLSIGVNAHIPYLAIFMTLLASFLGLFASMFIPSAPSSVENLKIDLRLWRATLTMLKQANKAPGLLVAILTISWFWLVGAVLLTKLPDYCHYVLGANTTVFALFLALFSIGIALGSLWINMILKGSITLSLVPVAMLAFAAFTFDIYWSSPVLREQTFPSFIAFFGYLRHWRIAIDLLMLGFCGGLFVVPLYTYLQVASPPETRARTIAANNIYNSLFMVIGTGIVMLLLHFHVSIPLVFLLFSILNAIVAIILGIYLHKK